jgi:hypothetical protein
LSLFRCALALALALAPAATATASAGPAVAASVSPVPRAGPTFDGVVYAAAYSATTLYLGGDFSHAIVAGRRIARTRLAAVDVRTGALLPWAPVADGPVRSIAIDPMTRQVYVGGAFSTIDGVARTDLAVLDPVRARLGGFAHGILGDVRALAIGGGRLYAGGLLHSVDGRTVGNLVAFRTGTGSRDPGFAATAGDSVEAIAVAGTRVYVGGLFRQFDGVGHSTLVAVDPGTGAVDVAFRPIVGTPVLGFAVGSAGVYTALGGQGGRVAEFALDGTPVWTRTSDGDVHAVVLLRGVLYLGGHFDNVCVSNANGLHGTCTDGSISRVKLAALDAGTGGLLPWNPRGNGVHGVFALAASPASGRLAAGGAFTTIGGIPRLRFAQFGFAWLGPARTAVGGRVRTPRGHRSAAGDRLPAEGE